MSRRTAGLSRVSVEHIVIRVAETGASCILITQVTAMMADDTLYRMFAAARRGDMDGIARLVDDEPCLLEVRTLWYNRTPLIEAAKEGQTGVVRLLLRRGAEISANDISGNTALHYAATGGYEELSSLLLSNGADVSRAGELGMRPFMVASKKGHIGVLRLFLQRLGGRDLDWTDTQGKTALWWACHEGHAAEVRALLLAGANHTIVDTGGQTPRQVAEEVGRPQCTAVLEVSASVWIGHGLLVRLVCVRELWLRPVVNACSLQWWEGEMERAYVLHKARALHDDTTTRQQAPEAPLPAYLQGRVASTSLLPQVDVLDVQKEGQQDGKTGQIRALSLDEEGMCAMVGYVVKDLDGHLYKELMEGLRCGLEA